MKRWLALALALLMWAGLAEGAGRELSGYFGKPIAEAAAELGGLSFEAGEEFAENYLCDGMALRGNGGVVKFIQLRDSASGDTLCGIGCGQSREEVRALMSGCPLLWDYPEEMAWTVRADPDDELKNEILVVFFDDGGKATGAWYRSSEA